MPDFKQWYVYILKLKNGAYYTGITNNISKRLKLHEAGKGSKYVRSNLPLILVYTEKVKNRSQATKREKIIKKLKRNEKEKLVERRLK